MSRAIGPIPISFKSLPLLKKHEADAAKLKSTHYIVCHGGDEDRHHAEHYREIPGTRLHIPANLEQKIR